MKCPRTTSFATILSQGCLAQNVAAFLTLHLFVQCLHLDQFPTMMVWWLLLMASIARSCFALILSILARVTLVLRVLGICLVSCFRQHSASMNAFLNAISYALSSISLSCCCAASLLTMVFALSLAASSARVLYVYSSSFTVSYTHLTLPTT